MTNTFRILHVCTGNIGRSPMAQILMRHQLDRRLDNPSDFSVASAGTWGCAGSSPEPFAGLALGARGLSTGEFTARELDVDMLDEADLVLTATVEHRSHVVGMLPSVVRRTFTLKEFARVEADARISKARASGDQSVQERARHNVMVASSLRGTGLRTVDHSDDIEDPLGAPAQVYEMRAAEIDVACSKAVDLLLASRH